MLGLCRLNRMIWAQQTTYMNIDNDQVQTKWPCNKVDEIINKSVKKAQCNMPRKIYQHSKKY